MVSIIHVLLEGLHEILCIYLQSTAVLSMRPSSTERPLSCSLQSLEVFSCSLAAEDETALSIIDPMIVTIELNNNLLAHQRTSTCNKPGGLLDAYSDQDKPPVMEVYLIITSKYIQ